MIFPSSGQNLHTVDISFPDSDKPKKPKTSAPKFVVSDSEKRLPVTDVESTATGEKIKFVHHGIRMVMFENSKLTKEDLIKNVKVVNPPHVGGLSGLPLSTAKKPHVHVYSSDEVMPDFLEKLTVGMYSPERSVQNFQQSAGRLTADSHISTIHEGPRSPHSTSESAATTVAVGVRGDTGKDLMLDQYLNIHTYGSADASKPPSPSITPGKPGIHLSIKSELEAGVAAKIVMEKKDSPKRLDVPLLDIFGTQTPGSQGPPRSDHSASHSAMIAPTSAGHMSFDDSAPTTAVPGPKTKPRGADLSKQLSAILDQPASKLNSPNVSALTSPARSVAGSKAPSPRLTAANSTLSLDISSSTYPDPNQPNPFPQNESPASAKSAPFDVNAHFDLHKLLDAPTPKVVASQRHKQEQVGGGSPVKSIVVKLEGATFSPPGAGQLGIMGGSGDDFCEVSERSFGVDSLSALSDSVGNGPGGDLQKHQFNSKTSTRANQLREQMTRANLARMDSLVGASTKKGAIYTSKTLIGANKTNPEVRDRVKRSFVKAARLIVAFRGKNVVNKSGPAFALQHAPDGPTSPVLPRGMLQSIAHPPTAVVVVTAALDSLASQRSQPAEPTHRSTEPMDTSLSIMTDSVFDDSPSASAVPSPINIPTGIASTGMHVTPTGAPRSSNVAHRKSETPQLVAKQSLFDFKPPEEVDASIKPRKNVGKFMENLKERMGSSKAHLIEQQLAQAEDSDSSVVTSYFDHNAAPIYVEREKVEKHKLQSKRFDKSPDSREYRSRRNALESDEEDSRVYERGDGQDDFGMSTGRGGGLSSRDEDKVRGPDGLKAPSSSVKTRPGSSKEPFPKNPKPVFDLNKFIASLTELERTTIASFPQETMNNLVEGMNAAMADSKGPKTANKRNLTMFKTLLEQMRLAKLEVDRLNMDIQMEQLDISDRAASLTVSSVHGGAVIVLLVQDNSAHKTHVHATMTLSAVESLRGLVAYESREIPANSFVDVTFTSLRPHTSYFAYAVADSTEAKLLAITDEDRLPHHLVVNTQQEILDIEWSRLTKEMQIVEIKAALRSNWLREAAAAHYPVITLPVDDDIHLGETVDVSSLEKPDEKTRNISPAKNRKATAALPSPNEQQKNIWRAFLEWWVGQSTMYVTKIRSEFHLREALFAAQQDYVTSKYLDSGLVKKEEITRLVAYAAHTEADLASGKVRKDTMLTSQEFRRFRSWYKGGQLLQDVVEEAIRTDGTARSLTGEQAAEVQATLDRQLAVRDRFLQLRIDDVEACKAIVRELVSSHAHAVQNNLTQDDLLYNRAALSPQDLIAIMSSKRLLQLCISAQLTTEQAGLEEIPLSAYAPAGKYNYMKIANTGIFTVVNHRNLRPEDPPSIVMCTLPGTSRKPLKAWQLCSYNEKMMEISIACSLDNILRLALADRIVVPNPEDVTHPPGKFPSRDGILARFIAWYAGEEEQDRVPGHAPPTLARTVFGETWETDSVRQDPFVLETLYEHDILVPEQFEGHSQKIRASFLAPPGKHRAVSILGGQPLSFFDPLIELYQETICKISGAFLRSGLMSRHLSAILGCRRMVMLRWLWPPGAARTGRQFLFPRMGLTALPFDLPPARIKPFPSRRPDAYTIQEMVRWYSPAVLDEDDALMVAGEAEGVRLRAYHNWLAQEKDRQEDSRRLMLQEDFDGHMRREIFKEVEYRMRTHANKLQQDAERVRDQLDSDKEIELKFSASLPAEYWYIFEESQEFKYGSGVHNEDELEEYREAERKRARDAEIEAEKFENYLQEEIMRRDAEEQLRLKREDQDRRLAEGVARRRRLREHLEELKRAKLLRIEEAERQRIETERRNQEEATYAEYMRHKEKEKLAERTRLLKEQQQMQYEDILVSDNRARSWEVKRMEHEDIRSFMREQQEAQETIKLQESYQALEDLYRPFDPFPEQLVGDHMRSLQGLLHHGACTGVDRIYQEVMDTLSQSSSHRKSLEQTTESMDRKRSVRYIRIFEGTDGAHRPVDTDATSVSCSTSLQLGLNVTEVDDVNIDDEDEVQSRREMEKFNWLRKPSSPPVRSVTHNPTKHTIRSNSSKMPNTYDTQWNVLNNNSTQCFVRTSSETFHTAEPLPTMRKLSSMAPMLRPLQETLSFEEDRPRHSINAPTPKAPSRQSGNEAEILKKFGSMFPVSMPSSRAPSVRSNLPLTPAVAPTAAADGPRISTDHTFVFDDSMVLDSIDGTGTGTAGGGSGAVIAERINSILAGAEHGGNAHTSAQMPIQSTVHTSQSVQEPHTSAERAAHPSATVHFSTESISTATGTADVGTFTGSSLSVFNSITPIEQGGAAHAKKQSKERKKLKSLLSNSADMLAKTNEKEWLQFLQTQRKATFASLATLDAKTAAEKLRIEKLTATVGNSASSVMAAERPVSRGTTAGGLSELRDKKIHVELLRKELKELGIVEETLLDFRTRKMAKSASEAAIRMKAEKDMLREYVTSGAVLRDEYYLMAVQPGTRSVPSLEVSEEVKKFAAEVTQHVDGEEELQFPSVTSSLEIAAPPKAISMKPKSPAVASRSAPKVSLHFGPYQPPTDLFIDQTDEPQVKEPVVMLDLGVRGLSRTQEDLKGKSSKKAKATSAKIGVPMNQLHRDQRELASSSFLSFNSLSTLSGPPSGNTAANPLGVIRGNPVPTAKEAPSSKHRRAAATRTSASSSSVLPLGVASLSLAEGTVEKKSSMLSKSVELFIHTPTSRKGKTKRKSSGQSGSVASAEDDFEESVASTADISITERQWLQQDGLQRPPPSYSAARTSGGASVASLDSASLILDER